MTWKFPGTDRVGRGVDSTIEDMGLWDERERIAKKIYRTSGLLLDWESLSERDRKPWREMAYAEMQPASSVPVCPHCKGEYQPHQVCPIQTATDTDIDDEGYYNGPGSSVGVREGGNG